MFIQKIAAASYRAITFLPFVGRETQSTRHNLRHARESATEPSSGGAGIVSRAFAASLYVLTSTFALLRRSTYAAYSTACAGVAYLPFVGSSGASAAAYTRFKLVALIKMSILCRIFIEDTKKLKMATHSCTSRTSSRSTSAAFSQQHQQRRQAPKQRRSAAALCCACCWLVPLCLALLLLGLAWRDGREETFHNVQQYSHAFYVRFIISFSRFKIDIS